MALTKPAISVLWAAAATKSVAAGGSAVSDAFAIAADEVSGEFILVATSGATDTGYQVNFFLLGSADGTNYSSAADTALFLGNLTMAAVSTTYRSAPINLPLGLENYKIYVENNNTGADAAIVDVELKALKLA